MSQSIAVKGDLLLRMVWVFGGSVGVDRGQGSCKAIASLFERLLRQSPVPHSKDSLERTTRCS